jgi:heavy metal translocating P-type ATPase
MAIPPSPFCAHCGLPIPGAAVAAPGGEVDEPEYCCFGCSLAAAADRERIVDGEIGATCFRLALSVFLSLNVMIFTMWLWTQEIYGSEGTNGTATAVLLWSVCRYLCLVFSLPVLWMLGGPVAEGAWKSLRRGVPTTDLLLVAGTLAAYAYSVVSTVRGSGPVYFEIGCAVLVLVTLGRWLEARGKQQAVAALTSLEKLLPAEVRRYDGDELRNVPLDAVQIGDRLHVVAGERLPTDGRIVRGVASIDAQLLTGESRPIVREPGDSVLGGTLNLDGDLTIEVTASPRGGSWQRLLECLRAARQMKGRYQQLADRIAAWFMPAVGVVALATFAYHTTHDGLDRGLLAALAVVLVACPCALGLATPLAVWAALGTAARAQVLFRHGEALERLAGVRVFAFDKTGTLTDGQPSVEQLAVADETLLSEILGRTLSTASATTHDLSRALVAYCRTRHVGSVPLCNVRTLPGRGLEASFAELATPLWLGSERLMREREMKVPRAIAAALQRFRHQAVPFTCVGWNGEVQAVFSFREQLRTSSRPALAACRDAGLAVEVLTGDHAARGHLLGRELGVVVWAELLPEDKVRRLVALRSKVGPIAMIGDGMNDAPALSAADVGMALGCGADVSQQSADVCLLGNDLSRAPWAYGLARQTIRIVRQNLFWTFAYNLVALALAASGRLNPIWAAAAMAAGGFWVVGNSLRLAHYPLPVEPSVDELAVTPQRDAMISQTSPESVP